MQAVLYLSEHGNGRPVLLRDISANLKIPYHFLSKVMQTLTRLGYVHSAKGINGGFALAMSPHSFTLIDIVRSIDGEHLLGDACLLGFADKNCENPCAVHDAWEKSKHTLLQTLSKKTIAELTNH